MRSNESAFWQFSLRFYAAPNVAPACIELQDKSGVDVNLLFYLIFLSGRQRALDRDEVARIDAATAAWRTEVVQPLRALRRRLKTGVTPMDASVVNKFRDDIKRSELNAERIQQETLERELPPASIGKPAVPRDAIRTNLAAYSALLGGLPATPITALIAAFEKFVEAPAR